MAKRRSGPTVTGHDDSKVTAISRGGDMKITAHDRCEVSFFDESAVGRDKSSQQSLETIARELRHQRLTELAERYSIKPADKQVKVDWTKWGTIIGGIALAATIIIAVIH